MANSELALACAGMVILAAVCLLIMWLSYSIRRTNERLFALWAQVRLLEMSLQDEPSLTLVKGTTDANDAANKKSAETRRSV